MATRSQLIALADRLDLVDDTQSARIYESFAQLGYQIHFQNLYVASKLIAKQQTENEDDLNHRLVQGAVKRLLERGKVALLAEKVAAL